MAFDVSHILFMFWFFFFELFVTNTSTDTTNRHFAVFALDFQPAVAALSEQT